MPKSTRFLLLLSVLLLVSLACGESSEKIIDTTSPDQDTNISREARPRGNRILELDESKGNQP